MAQFFSIHPDNPQPRLIRRAVNIIHAGGLVAYPTDSCYALGCHIGDKEAAQRIRMIRQVDARHHFTLMCRDLSEVGSYAQVNNSQYRLLKAAIPGSYTFILNAKHQLPRQLVHPKRKTIGLRIPAHPIAHALLQELNEPLLSSTLILPNETTPLDDAHEIRDRLEHELDLIIDGGSCGLEMSTVIDLTSDIPQLIRKGRGDLARLGLVMPEKEFLNHK